MVGGGPGRPGGIGGIGGPGKGGVGGPGGIGGPGKGGIGGPAGIGGPGRPGGIGGPGTGPGGIGGIGGPGRPGGPGGIGAPGRPGGIGGIGGLGGIAAGAGLGALAKSQLPARPSTRPIDRQNLVNQSNLIRNNFNNYNCFHGGWWAAHPGAWRAGRWLTAGAVWGAVNWATCSSYCGYPANPVYYDYGSNVVYEGDTVYVNGDAVGTPVQYAEQAVVIADTGKQSPASKEEDWLALGVWAMVQGEQTNGNDLFQLAVNKQGVIRGNYYNVLSDTTLAVYGSVDKKTQRAAWTVGDRKDMTYEAGFANLTKPETTVLVHFGTGNTQQWTLIRLEQPADEK